jgi:hypothetical protein
MGPAADRRPGTRALAAAAVAASTLAACSSGDLSSASTSADRLPQGDETVRLDPADMTVDITNKYWPMTPGQTWVYEETDGDGTVTRDEVTVLDRTQTIDGIEARVVHDLATQNGQTVEDTTDWYAQDSQGTVWYLGEQTAEYANGQVSSTEGSWVAGKDGAQPGVLLPADPAPGTTYRQEYLEGEAQDEARVLSTDERAQTPTGTYDHALLTRDTTPLEPDLVELKWYVPDVGPVLTLTPSGEVSREQLVQAPDD